MDGTPPGPATNLSISPDTGVSATDGRTTATNVTLSGVLPELDLTATVFDVTKAIELGQVAVNGTSFTHDIAFISAGTHRLRVRATDTAGNYSDSFFDVFVDRSNPMVDQVVTRSAVAVIEVEFSEPMAVAPMILDGSIAGAFSLTNLDHGPIAMGAERFSYDAASHVLSVSMTGLGSEVAFLDPGNYQFEIDGSQLPDLAGNLLRGGSGGMVRFDFPAFDGAENLQADGSYIRVANYSVPSIVDWDSNGVPDLIVGEKTAASEGKVRVYLNSGTAADPVYGDFFYALSDGAELALPGAGCLGVFPRVFDWNQDGMKDLVVGRADGKVQVLLNINSDAEPMFGPASFVQVGLPGLKSDIDVGDRATLDIVDFNNDDRYDLVLGALDGTVRVLLNEAASEAADFGSERVLSNGAAGDLIVPSGRSSVDVVDLNGDGRKDLVLGNTEGQLLFYANTGTDAEPEFDGFEPLRADGTVIDLPESPRSRQFVGDFDGDGVVDLLVGARDGLVRLYHGQPTTAVGEASNVNDGEPGGIYTYTFAAEDPRIIGQHIFYNRSSYDGHNGLPNAADDQAIATDKRALLPGQTATFENYTNYSRGINGIIIDIAVVANRLAFNAADDLELKVGNGNDPEGWTPAPAPSFVTVRSGEGEDGSDRVTLVWPDNAIEKQWIQVTVKATPNTGLLAPHVFSFGSAPGEAGDNPINTIVNATDEIVARNFQHSAINPALIDDPYDYNRDGLVNATDQIIARQNQTNPLTMLRLITATAADVVIEQIAEPKAADPEALTAALDWLVEYEQMNSKKASAEDDKAFEAAVDKLLATDWQ